jgi:hypothetical protein
MTEQPTLDKMHELLSTYYSSTYEGEEGELDPDEYDEWLYTLSDDELTDKYNTLYNNPLLDGLM